MGFMVSDHVRIPNKFHTGRRSTLGIHIVKNSPIFDRFAEPRVVESVFHVSQYFQRVEFGRIFVVWFWWNATVGERKIKRWVRQPRRIELLKIIHHRGTHRCLICRNLIIVQSTWTIRVELRRNWFDNFQIWLLKNRTTIYSPSLISIWKLRKTYYVAMADNKANFFAMGFLRPYQRKATKNPSRLVVILLLVFDYIYAEYCRYTRWVRRIF